MALVDDGTIPADVQFIETHEYIRADEDRARIGISHYAAEQLGDVVFVELPELGQILDKGDSFGSIESVKAASDLYMPVSGEVVAVNAQLTSEPELVNDNPYGDGWMIEIMLRSPEEIKGLMMPKDYQIFLDENASH